MGIGIRRGVCESALEPRGVWEGPWRIGQGSEPDLRAVRDYRGASGNVALVELCTHLAYRKGEAGKSPPVRRRARALSQQTTSESWETCAASRLPTQVSNPAVREESPRESREAIRCG